MRDFHQLSREEPLQYRKSGLLLASLAALLYLLPLLNGKHHPSFLVAAALLALCSAFELPPLRWAIRLLVRTGNIMHRFTNPVLFGLIYLLAVVPTALVLKLTGKNVLHLGFDRQSSSYWLARPENDRMDSFRNQF